MTRKRDDAALWRAIKEQEAADDLAEIEAMSDAELDKYLSDNGGDPKGIRERGRALGERLLARARATDGRAVQSEIAEKVEAFRAEATQRARGPALPRPELLARLDAARKDPRFAAPVAVLFQKKAPEASTDEELLAVLEAIELLATIEKA